MSGFGQGGAAPRARGSVRGEAPEGGPGEKRGSHGRSGLFPSTATRTRPCASFLVCNLNTSPCLQQYAPSVFEKYATSITIGKKEVILNLYDTAGRAFPRLGTG